MQIYDAFLTIEYDSCSPPYSEYSLVVIAPDFDVALGKSINYIQSRLLSKADCYTTVRLSLSFRYDSTALVTECKHTGGHKIC